MKILFLTDNFPPEVNAPASRTYEHCLQWVKMGVDVTVITCAPNFPQGKVYPGYRNRLKQTETIDGIKVIRVWTYIAANKGFLKRILDYISFAFTAFWAGLFLKTDVIVATSPQFFTTWAGYALSVFKRKPWVFELRDLWPETIRSVGAMSSSKVLDWLEKIELYLYRHADLVVALTPAFKRNLIERGIDGDKITIVTNGVNLDQFQSNGKDAALVEKLQLDQKFTVGYIGTHGVCQKLGNLVQGLDQLPDPGVQFLFIGDGAEKEEIMAIAKEKGLTNVSFLDPVSKDEVPKYWSVIDTALVPLAKSDTFKTVIPSKIFEAVALGKPILLGVEGQAREIVDQYEAGLCFEPDNPGDLIARINALREDPELFQKIRQNCETMAKDFDRSHLARKMYDMLEALVKS